MQIRNWIMILLVFICNNYVFADNGTDFNKQAIKSYTDEQLLLFLTENYMNDLDFNDPDEYFAIVNSVRDELVRRKQTNKLLKCFLETKDENQRFYVVDVLSTFKDEQIAKVFKKNISSDLTKSNYLSLFYLAKRGDLEALKLLNDNFTRFPIPSYVFCDAVKLFGDYHYKPAINNLLEGLHFADWSITSACIYSLDKILNLKKRKFKDSAEARAYYMDKIEKQTTGNSQ